MYRYDICIYRYKRTSKNCNVKLDCQNFRGNRQVLEKRKHHPKAKTKTLCSGHCEVRSKEESEQHPLKALEETHCKQSTHASSTQYCSASQNTLRLNVSSKQTKLQKCKLPYMCLHLRWTQELCTFLGEVNLK